MTRRAGAGFTLLELVFIIVILGALAKFAIAKLIAPAAMTLPAQAQSLADLIRRAQSLAVVRGQRTRVSVTASGANGAVAVACVASAPCSTDSSLSASQGAVVGSTPTIYFNSLGQPVNSTGVALSSDTNFTLSYTTGGATATHTITVAAVTGRVSISP